MLGAKKTGNMIRLCAIFAANMNMILEDDEIKNLQYFIKETNEQNKRNLEAHVSALDNIELENMIECKDESVKNIENDKLAVGAKAQIIESFARQNSGLTASKISMALNNKYPNIGFSVSYIWIVLNKLVSENKLAKYGKTYVEIKK